MTITQLDAADLKRSGRRVGYIIAIVINVVLLYVVNNLLAWGLPFLTDDFSEVVPLISLSLLVSVAANTLYLFVDTPVVKSATQIAVNSVSIVATVAVLRVFPFDFSDYAFDWAIVARILLIVAIVGTGIAIVVDVAKLATGTAGRSR
jgi:hypothetical protein